MKPRVRKNRPVKVLPLKVLPRTYFGDPILRRRARLVSTIFIKNRSFPHFIRTMFHTMQYANGVGLAAPQIGKSIQLAVIGLARTKFRPKLRGMLKSKNRFIIINPKIIAHSAAQTLEWEGCLSLPGLRGIVPRYKDITVKFLDEHGTSQTIKASGFLARVFQHEIDHLSGLGYIDRMRDMKTLTVL